MRHSARILVASILLTVAAAGNAVWAAQSASGQPAGSPPVAKSPDAADQPESVDGIAARIEDDILTESEVRELAAFQRLVGGQAKPRDELIRELAEQWVTRGEADTSKFPKPSETDVDNAYQELAMQFNGTKELESHIASEGLTVAAVRRMLAQQMYLSRFLDYRFRPAVQVDDAQVEKFYNEEFAPQVKQRGQPVPALESVEETIREVLVQREITRRADEWLDEARGHLQIETLHDGSAR
jgi:hypothetical protein